MRNRIMMTSGLMFLLLVVSGCLGGLGSTNSLECSYEEEEYGMLNRLEYKLVFDSNDEPIEIDMVMILEHLDATEEEVIETFDAFTGMYDQTEDQEGVSVSTDRDGKVITITINYDLEEVAEAGSESEAWLDLDLDEEITKEEIKAELIAEGFTCK